jgi:hypothetical protein
LTAIPVASRGFAVLRRSLVVSLLGAGACSEGREAVLPVVTSDTLVELIGVIDTARIRVSVGNDSTPIAGRYFRSDSGLVFRPLFPFDSGREYKAVLTRRSGAQVAMSFKLPARSRLAATRVTQIYPTPDTLPENQLRIYIEFSAPMSREGGLPFVKLLDGDGKEVKNAFLPIDAEFWNHEHTRHTLFLDPGRVKRGILPNEEMGRALVAGKRYSIVVDSSWRDGRGQPLVASHAKRFRARAADYKPISLDSWTVLPPRAASTSPLIVRFGEPLDHGLLVRALGVEDQTGKPIDGRIDVSAGEDEWRFTPAGPWVAGDYRILVLEFLEDLAGNRVNRAFEVDLFTRADSTTRPSRFTLPFRVR